jgi:hypothetical protein
VVERMGRRGQGGSVNERVRRHLLL